jgi:DegV family protein with EDD domain
MGKVAVVTDSTAYLEPGIAEELGISVIPLEVHLGGRVFRDGIDLTPDAFFQRVEQNSSTVRVLPPSVQQFQRLYAQLHTRTDQILSIHLSSELNPALVNAQRGAEALLGRCDIAVIDSLTTSLGLGVLATAAAQAANEGSSLDDIVRLVRGMIPHVYVVFYTTDLEALERSRHLSSAQTFLGSLLNIKPILFMEDGRIMALEKVRTHERAVDKLAEFMAEFAHVERAAIVQRRAGPTAETRLLLDRLQPIFPGVEFPILQYGPALAVHIGLSAMGIVVYEGME